MPCREQVFQGLSFLKIFQAPNPSLESELQEARGIVPLAAHKGLCASAGNASLFRQLAQLFCQRFSKLTGSFSRLAARYPGCSVFSG